MLKALRLSEIADALNGRVVGDDCAFSAVSTDSRSIVPGQLFIALSGPRFDGHDYLAQVAAKGAVAFMTPVSELAPGQAAAVYLIQSNGGR